MGRKGLSILHVNMLYRSLLLLDNQAFLRLKVELEACMCKYP